MVTTMLTSHRKGNRMNAIWVTVDELALVLNRSVESIRRAYRKGDIPIVRIGSLVRFDVEDVKKTMERDKHEAYRRHIAESLERRTPGGASRRRARPNAPGLVTRGR
jgi:excisionase family DNA binding protein